MTWAEWVNSEYNDRGVVIDASSYAKLNGYFIIKSTAVSASDIITNYAYTLSELTEEEE